MGKRKIHASGEPDAAGHDRGANETGAGMGIGFQKKKPQRKADEDGGVAAEKYKRGERNIISEVQDKKLKMKIKRSEKAARDAAAKAARAEILLPSEAGYLEGEGLEKTQRFQQHKIKAEVDSASAKKIFTLRLDDLGPYRHNYSRNGRHLLLGGRRGHLALCDWVAGKLACEVQVKETVRDVTFLHNETLFAAAQKKYVYIYDHQGLEVHCMRNHIEVNRMAFLPYHFLLATVGNAGYLKFQDTSTGQLVSELRTKLGRCDTLTLNPYNAVTLLGHTNGTVTMWSPTMTAPLVKMFCHRGPVAALATDSQGRYLATAGLDGQLNVYDCRTYKRLHSYFTPSATTDLDISQRGLLSVAFGTHVEIWKDALSLKAKAPYMSHHTQGLTVQSAAFCPFEDVLGLGHSNGFSSILVPGSGEANFDSMEANPFQTKRQRREAEVHSLLDKLQPEMITLDPHFVGNVDRAPSEVIRAERQLEKQENMTDAQRAREEKRARRRHARGRDKIGKRQRKKQANVVEERKQSARQHLAEGGAEHVKKDEGTGGVLDRFKYKSDA